MSAPLSTCMPCDLPALIAMRVVARKEAEGVTVRAPGGRRIGALVSLGLSGNDGLEHQLIGLLECFADGR